MAAPTLYTAELMVLFRHYLSDALRWHRPNGDDHLIDEAKRLTYYIGKLITQRTGRQLRDFIAQGGDPDAVIQQLERA